VARGAEFWRNTRYEDAEAEFRAAILLAPEEAVLHADLGFVLGCKGDGDGEIAEEREALRLDPNNELAHYNLGVRLGSKGDWDGTVTEEREVLRINPENESAHYNLGVALGRRGDSGGAIAEYREALRLNPKNENAHLNLGAALGEKGDLDGEITEERQALRLDPNNALAGLAQTLFFKVCGSSTRIAPKLVAITVSEFPTVGFSHTCIPNLKHLILDGSSRFCKEEPAVRKALTAATSFYRDRGLFLR
jgi:Flp pilus assembly protein TadD